MVDAPTIDGDVVQRNRFDAAVRWLTWPFRWLFGVSDRQPIYGGARTLHREAYDSNKANDEARRTIAMMLLRTLIFVILFAFAVLAGILFWAQPNNPAAANESLVDLLNIIFGPVVTLVGSATGFYFGANSRGRDTPPPNQAQQPETGAADAV